MTQEPLWKPSDISPDAMKEAESDGDGPKRRGRIPQSAWPRILEMYKGGATLSAIAREFECTPSAISYIIRKAEADGALPEGGAPEPAPAKTAAPNAGGEPDAPQPRPAEAPQRNAEPRAPRPEPRAERATPEGRRPLTMGGPLTPQPQAQPQPQPSPRQGEIRHSDGRPGDRMQPERVQADGAPVEARVPQEARAPNEQRFRDRRQDEQRGDMRPRHQEHRQHDQRGQEQRGYDNRGGDGRGDNRGGEPRGFGNRPPRDDMRPQRDMREDRYRDDRNSGGDDDFSDIGTFNRPAGHAAYPYRQQRNPARQEALETPTEPADQRMDAAAKVCAELYRAWKANGGDNAMQSLADSLHEMRKVIARMEIEMSASRREEQKPVPMPAYRLNQPAPQQPRG